MNTKPWLSKTLWMSLLVAVAAFFPAVSKFVAENPQAVLTILSLVFGVLRLVTKGRISIE